MGFQIRFINYHKSIFIAHLIKIRRIGIVTGTNCVEIVLFHQGKIGLYLFCADCKSREITKDSAAVNVDICFSEPAGTTIIIEDKYGTAVARGEISKDGLLELTVPQPVLWNTEHPYLYTIIFDAEDEVIVDYIGFRTIEVKESVIYLNGEKIKFRGVNRHDSDPETGFTVSAEQIKTDLTLMKQHNFNAIRSSHYPSHFP